ncbi:MAG: hypothetical protein DMF72_13585 [Acidobacteria bacterium]|nr:MAG: hypothetical protein DMF72_13585 [Acidobacteriota bacterium]
MLREFCEITYRFALNLVGTSLAPQRNGFSGLHKHQHITLSQVVIKENRMNVASRAIIGDTVPVRPPIRVLPFNSPLRAIPGINRVSRSRIFPRGAVVFHEGSIARGVYVLSSGRAKVSISSADGRKVILRIAHGGDVLGLYAGLTGRAFEATAEMVEVFSRQFSEFVDHTRMLLLSESALEKLARLIFRWGRDFGERTGEGIRVQILLTQEEIAQIIGASRETVTRLFSALKRDKIIRVKRDALWIRDSAALASLAQMSPEMCG